MYPSAGINAANAAAIAARHPVSFHFISNNNKIKNVNYSDCLVINVLMRAIKLLFCLDLVSHNMTCLWF